MRVLVVLSPFLLGASLAHNSINKFIPDIDFDNEDCIGDACFLRNQLMSIDRSKEDPSTGLAYNERILAYVNTQKLLDVCLPKVAKEAVADSFTSCNNTFCVFAKRGWLVKDSQSETVANLDLLTTAFSGLTGGNEAVKKCLKIKEEAEASDDDYEYYDYAYYYDEYDYLEEGEVIEVRRKREAGNGGKNKEKKGKKSGKNANRNNKEKNGKKSKNGGKARKNKEKKGKKNGKNADRNNKKKNGKNNKNKNEGNKERKYVNKKPSEENAAKTNAQLSKFGFSKIPTKSTMDELECMWDELEDLLVKCGETIISNSP